MDSQYHKGLHYFALATAGATFLLLIAGALVTSNDAGLSVPDWPLSHGQWMPEMVGGVFYEHGCPFRVWSAYRSSMTLKCRPFRGSGGEMWGPLVPMLAAGPQANEGDAKVG